MRIAILFLMIVAFVSGCATSKKTYTSDGREGYSINCSGSALNWGMWGAIPFCGKTQHAHLTPTTNYASAKNKRFHPTPFECI